MHFALNGLVTPDVARDEYSLSIRNSVNQLIYVLIFPFPVDSTHGILFWGQKSLWEIWMGWFYFEICFYITIYNQGKPQSDELFKINYWDNIAEINPLSPEDAVLDYGPLGNFSLAGFEMVLTRYVSTYIITYYLPSGESQSRAGGLPSASQ